jgi:hypothetical protein
MDYRTGKYKGLLYDPASQEEIRKAIGEPIESYKRSFKDKTAPAYAISEFDAYDVFAVRGKIHKPGAGNKQSIQSAATVGLSEIYYIPATLVKLAVAPFKKRTLVVFYDKNATYLAHQLFDSEGRRESISE